MSFLDSRYLLESDMAKSLFDSVAALPIVDVHNHADVLWIADNRKFSDPWQLFAASDHYVWEIMRKCGAPEEMITGKASAFDKWMTLAKIFPRCVGNPVYEWIHLDLKQLGIENVLLNEKTGKYLWDECCRILASDEASPVNLLKKMNVETVCSTDDPADLLKEHEKANQLFGRTVVRPTWRPDKAMNIFQRQWSSYIRKLETRFERNIHNLNDLIHVLEMSHQYFQEHGTIASDHGIEKPWSGDASYEDADAVFRKALNGGTLTQEEQDCYCSYVLRECAGMDAKTGWVFQMHIGAVRDVRDSLYRTLGPDSGGDVSDHAIDIVKPLCRFLNHFDGTPLKTVLYCLDSGHYSSLAAVSRAFGANVRLGSAWWLNDTPVGMKRQLEYIGSVDVLNCFAGMVSDSRKLLSYGSRFQMFRRVLCSVIGGMVQRGQIPEECAFELVSNMCYYGPKEFFHI